MTQNNYYWYWQRVKPSSSPDRITRLANSMSYSMTVTLFPSTVAAVISGNGHHLISAHENSGHPAEPLVTPEETTDLAENQDEKPLEDPYLHLNIEELKKDFMVKNEEVYDSLMSCHWQPLDIVHSKIPDEPPLKHEVH